MSVNPELILMGPAEVWHGLTGVTEPADAEVAPGAGWEDVGSTDGGVTLTASQTYTDVEVDQTAQAVDAMLTGQGQTVSTNLAEATLPNLRRAMNMAASAATKMEFGGELITATSPLYSAIMLRGKAPDGEKRLVILRRTLSTEGVGIPFQKAGKTVVPITWKAYFVSSSVRACVIDDTQAA